MPGSVRSFPFFFMTEPTPGIFLSERTQSGELALAAWLGGWYHWLFPELDRRWQSAPFSQSSMERPLVASSEDFWVAPARSNQWDCLRMSKRTSITRSAVAKF